MSARKETHDTKIFAERLARGMHDLGLNQSLLSEQTGIQRQTISLYLKGVTAPAADKLISLSIALQCSTDWLLGLTEYKNSELAAGSIGAFGFGDGAVTALADDISLVNDLDLLLCGKNAVTFFKHLSNYYSYCVAARVVEEEIKKYQMQNEGCTPSNEFIISAISDYPYMSNLPEVTQEILKTFCRCLAAPIDTFSQTGWLVQSVDDNLKLMQQAFDYQVHKGFSDVLDGMEEEAERYIKLLSGFKHE